MTIHEEYPLELTDEELDSMLAQWVDAEMDVPEGFHESVVMRLREEDSKQTQAVQAPQQKNKIVSLTERFANKKAWVSTIAAATLVLCCLPVLQDRQSHLAGVENSAVQAYEMKSRIIEGDDGTNEEAAMMNAMLVDAQASPTASGTINDVVNVNDAMSSTEKMANQPQDSYSYTINESNKNITSEEQLKLLQDNLAEMESHLALLDDSVDVQLQREELQNKIDELKAEIKVLEEQVNITE